MQNQYDYNLMEAGFYDDIARRGRGIRSFWHNQKFKRVKDILNGSVGRVLDIGCASGTFLGGLPERTFSDQVGVDISRKQIAYAQKVYGNENRKFICIETIRDIGKVEREYFDYITIIEVIEHLTPEEIKSLITESYPMLKKGGKLIITTPNYTSFWPILEMVVNVISPVKYKEQHVTKFTYFDFERKIAALCPDFRSCFAKEFISTTHFIAPFIAGISYRFAGYVSSWVNHNKWRFPFGNLILCSFIKK